MGCNSSSAVSGGEDGDETNQTNTQQQQQRQTTDQTHTTQATTATTVPPATTATELDRPPGNERQPSASDSQQLKPAPPSILVTRKRSKERTKASLYIASSSSPPASPPVLAVHPDGSMVVPSLSPAMPGRNLTAAANSHDTSNVELIRTASSPKNRKSNRRSSDGKRVMEHLARPPTVSDLNGHPAPDMVRKSSHTADGHHRRHHHSGRRHSVLKRRTSNNGMISRLALQFPLIRTSFLGVYRAFSRYMEIVKIAESEVKRKSLRSGQTITVTAPAATQPAQPPALQKAGTESALHSIRHEGRDLQLVETEGGAVSDLASITEDEARKAEIQLLLSEPLMTTPLMTPVIGPMVPSAFSETSIRVKQLGTLTVGKLGEAIRLITADPHGGADSGLVLPKEEIQRLFKLSDLDDSHTISIKEFLIAMACGYFLKADLDQLAVEKRLGLNMMRGGRRATSLGGGSGSFGQPPSPRPLFSSAHTLPAVATNVATEDDVTPQASPRVMKLEIEPPAPTGRLSPRGATFVQPGPTNTLQPPSPVSSSCSTAPALSPQHAEIQRGFRVVFHAFQEMDTDGSGSVDHAELKRALFATANLKNDEAILEKRFAELDFDSSGEIEFNEFLFGICAWVGLMHEDGDDLDEFMQLDGATTNSANTLRQQQ